MSQATDEPDVLALPGAIAVIGMACRFPGARSLEEFRRNLENGVESIRPLTDHELAQAGVDRALLSNPHYVKVAAPLEDADAFDAAFFEYSPREAAIMDPQQRLFLECAWEALEDAGHAGDVSGSQTGVFAGAGGVMSTYLLSDTHFNPQLTGPTASLQHVGNDKDYLSTRVSYKLNLRGPSLSVQTACSTSLVAVHLACQSLLTGECDMALGGGTTVRIPQRAGYLYKEGNVFSRDGQCRAFDRNAHGTVFSSGIGVVVLKRLRDALRDGDAIRAVIRGSAINNDGSENKTSYWAPHADGQARAMRQALAAARVDPRTIGYVEGHGTATRKGDPTEIRALTQAFGALPAGSCAIGSVKSNIGHPESAAGVAGLIKAVLSLEHKVLFPSLHYSQPNPEIDFAHGFFVNATRKTWQAGAFPRRAAVNSLGIGGTNAFVILEEAPERPRGSVAGERSAHVLCLSAKSPGALEELTQRFKASLEEQPDESPGDICYSANAGRAHFEYRRALVAESTAASARLLSPAPPGAIAEGRAAHGQPPRVAFLFTGQGSQYVGMAGELYRTSQTFRHAFDRCAETLSLALGQPLASIVYPQDGEPPLIDRTACTQPALFAVEYALATLWRSWGIEPSVLAGHSVGEIVAACLAGVMSLEDALRLTAARAQLMQALPAGGGMAALRCDAARAGEAIAAYAGSLSIAALNGPHDVVISGRLDALDTVASRLEREGISVTRLKVSHAFHSQLMDPMLEEFGRVAASLTYSPPAMPIVSNVTGQLATADIATAEYWVRHVRQSVRFAEGVACAHARGVDVFLEIGPSPVLLGMARHSVPAGSEAWLPSLRTGRSDWRQILESMAELYVRGADIDWNAVDRDYARQRVHLPTYPFQRQRYWIDAPAAADMTIQASHRSLLGQRLRLPGATEARYEARWSPRSPAYLDDHRIFDTVVVPGASHIAMVLSAMKEISGEDACVVEDAVFPQALTLSDDDARTAQLVLTPAPGGATAFQVMSLREGEDGNEPGSWVTHATGRAHSRRTHRSLASNVHGGGDSLAIWQGRCTRWSSGAAFYDTFWDAGYHLRGAFRWIANTWAGDGELLCELHWPELPDDPSIYPLYPSLIDACFQCVFADKARDLLTDDAVYVPFSIRRLVVNGSPAPGARLWCHVAVSQGDSSARTGVDASITLCDAAGRIVASIECQLREVRRTALLQTFGGDLRGALYEVEWNASPRPPAPAAAAEAGTWIVFADHTSSAAAGLIARLEARNQRCIQVSPGPRFGAIGAGRYEVDGTALDDVQRLLHETARDASAPCRGIVHLWNLDTLPMDAPGSPASRDSAIGSVLQIVQAMARLEWTRTPRVWLVTRGAQPVDPLSRFLAVEQAPAWGLGRTVALEHPELMCVRMDLDPSDRSADAQHLFDEIWAPDSEDQIAYRRGARHVARLVRSTVLESRAPGEHAGAAAQPVQVRISAYGQMENLLLQPLTPRAPGPGEVEIAVRAASLNFRDVLNALGLLEAHYAQHLGVTSASEMTFGFECAGTVVRTGDGVSGVSPGDDVVAVGCHDALASFVTLRAEFVAPKPAWIGFEDAATLPLAFLTAYYGMHRLARLQPGERVLIHAAAGGVGQACLQWAQHVGAEVFATASPAKWEFLQAAGVKHVFNSRSLDFAGSIGAATSGAGVDVVVNTLSGAFVDESFSVLKAGGRFVELGKRDVWPEEQARERRPDVSYFPFDLMEVAKRDPDVFASMLAEMISHLRAGTLKPLPSTVFPASRVADAFRYMAEARHIGKIVVSMPAPAGEGAATGIHGDGSYLITGGLGALGLELAGSLIEQGARHLVLTGRRAPAAEARAAIERLEQAGARIAVVEADVSDAAHVARLLSAVRETQPPLRGIVHAAGVLDDGMLVQQTLERFRAVMAPKVEGAWNLHAMLQDQPLDFFVCFSSVASLVGNPGQGNYAAANAFMDALAHLRRARGLPGLSINWGPWSDVGMAAGDAGQRMRWLAARGFRPIAPAQGRRVFLQLLDTRLAQVGVMPIDWPDFLRANPTGRAFFEKVAAREASAAPKRMPDIRRQIAEAADPRAVLAEHVRSVVGTVLGMRNVQDIDPRGRLFDLGLESLMAVEMRGRFEESIGCPLRPTLLFDYPTIEALVDHLAGKVLEARSSTADLAPPPAGAGADALDGLDEDDLAERLARELMASARVPEP